MKGSFKDVSNSEMEFLTFLTCDEEQNVESKKTLEQSFSEKENKYVNE